MLFRYLLFLHLVLFAAACTGRTGHDTATASEPQNQDQPIAADQDSSKPGAVPRSIAGIQQAYETIMGQVKNGALDSTSFPYNCNNEKSGTVSYFSEKGALRMIVHRYQEYDHHAAEDYYFVSDSLLFFIYAKTILWTFESGPAGSTKDQITEQRVYLVDQKPIRCLEKKFVIRSQAATNPRPETVAPQEMDCPVQKPLYKPFQVLLRHRNQAPSGCLED